MGLNPDTGRFELLDIPQEVLEAYQKKMAEVEARQREDDLKTFAEEKPPWWNDPELKSRLIRPDGSPVPTHWAVFSVDELVEVKGATFRVAYIGETAILLEPQKRVLSGCGQEPALSGADKTFKQPGG